MTGRVLPLLALVLVCHGGTARTAPAGPDLVLPSGAQETARLLRPKSEFRLPTGPWEDGAVPLLDLRGAVSRVAWKIPGQGDDTLALMDRLRATLATQGFQPVFACASDACGGFDFRFAIEVIAEPAMHVDLSDFRYFSAIRGQGPKAEHLGLLISRAGAMAFVELTHVGPEGVLPAIPAPPAIVADLPAAAPSPRLPVPPAGDLAGQLQAEGHAILEGLAFASGSVELEPGTGRALAELASWLASHPEATVAIVGHTDASGDLAANLELSRQRAQSVVARLVADHAAVAGQLSAQGAGPLAPIATNMSAEGRQKNRRVEVVLTSTR